MAPTWAVPGLLVLCNRMDVKKTQRVPFTVFGIVMFFKMIIFRLTIWFFQWTSLLYPNFKLFFEPSFFGIMRLLSNLFLSKSPRLLLETKRLASIENLLGFSVLCDIFRKRNFVSSWEKMVSESYRALKVWVVRNCFLSFSSSWAYFENFAHFEP